MKAIRTCAGLVAVLLTAGHAVAQSATDVVKGFSIVLVEGSLQAGTSSDLPGPASAAIADLKDFLPFKSYRLLDASWMLGSTGAKSRLRDGDRDYEIVVTAQSDTDAKNLSIKFLLRDAARQEFTTTASPRSEAGTVAFKRAQVEEAQMRLRGEFELLRSLREKYSEDHPSVKSANESIARNRDRLALLERSFAESLRQATAETPSRPAGALIDTSFSMRLGETVVVGTSRVNGDRALIAVMTAVPK